MVAQVILEYRVVYMTIPVKMEKRSKERSKINNLRNQQAPVLGNGRKKKQHGVVTVLLS